MGIFGDVLEDFGNNIIENALGTLSGGVNGLGGSSNYSNNSPVSDFSGVIQNVMETNYDVTAEFSIDLTIPEFIKKTVPGMESYWSNLYKNDRFSSLIEDVSVTNVNPDLIQSWVGGKYYYNITASKIGNIHIKFRSIDNGFLYKSLKASLLAGENEYPEDMFWSIIYKQLNHRNNSGNTLLKNSTLLMYNIGDLQSSQENTNFQTFVVSFAYRH